MTRQIFDGIREAESLVFHQEANGCPVGAAAEAVIELLAGADGKGGRLLFVKRAAGRVIGTGFFKRHNAVDDLDDIRTGKQLLDKGFGNHLGRLLRLLALERCFNALRNGRKVGLAGELGLQNAHDFAHIGRAGGTGLADRGFNCGIDFFCR